MWWIGLASIGAGIAMAVAAAIWAIKARDEWESVEEFSDFQAALRPR